MITLFGILAGLGTIALVVLTVWYLSGGSTMPGRDDMKIESLPTDDLLEGPAGEDRDANPYRVGGTIDQLKIYWRGLLQGWPFGPH